MHASIDRETGQLIGVDNDGLFTRHEIESLEIRCPVCGGPVVVAAVDTGTPYVERVDRRFMLGMKTCVRNRCDPIIR